MPSVCLNTIIVYQQTTVNRINIFGYREVALQTQINLLNGFSLPSWKMHYGLLSHTQHIVRVLYDVGLAQRWFFFHTVGKKNNELGGLEPDYLITRQKLVTKRSCIILKLPLSAKAP